MSLALSDDDGAVVPDWTSMHRYSALKDASILLPAVSHLPIPTGVFSAIIGDYNALVSDHVIVTYTATRRVLLGV